MPADQTTTAPEPAPTLTPRQDEILEAALGLVREEGWPGLTIRRLAERVGVTDPALYRHFKTKSDIALAMADRMGGLLLGPVRRLAADQALSARERLRRILEHHVALIQATDGLPVLLLSEVAGAGDDALAGRMRGIIDEYLALLAGLIAELPRHGDEPAPAERAMLLLGLPAVVALRLRMLPGAGPTAEAVPRLVGFVVDRLLGAPGEDVPGRGENGPDTRHGAWREGGGRR